MLFCYIFDTLIFCQGNLTQAMVIKLTLTLFEHLTGLKINYQKTGLVYMGSHHSLAQELTTIFNCQEGSFPIMYLGVPLSRYAPRRGDWDKIINHIERKLDDCQTNLLSISRKITLINLVLSVIPVYFMAIFRMLVNVIWWIEKVHGNFLSRGVRGNHGNYYLA